MIYENEIRPKVRVMTVTTEGAEVDIRNASFPKPFHIGLQYASPARGHWTIAHSPYLIPQCHQVYVCCACCLHGVVLSADEVEGGAERFSTVTVTNENIIKGNLEEMMKTGLRILSNIFPNDPGVLKDLRVAFNIFCTLIYIWYMNSCEKGFRISTL